MTTNEMALAEMQELHSGLLDAYWSASTIEGKDTIIGIASVVYDELTSLNSKVLQDRTAEYRTASASIKKGLDRLESLKKEIDNVVKNIQLASKLIAKIDEVAKIVAKAMA